MSESESEKAQLAPDERRMTFTGEACKIMSESESEKAQLAPDERRMALQIMVRSGKMGRKGEKMNYTYIVKCSDNTLYTGWTTDLKRRLKVHNEGKGAKYTRARLPVELAYFEEFETKEEAMRREYEIKQMTRQEKEKLLRSREKRPVC